MKTFGSITKKIKGLQFILEQLELLSPLGRTALLRQPYLHKANALQEIFDTTESMIALLQNEKSRKIIEKVALKLTQTNDISGTAKNLAAGLVPDDIQLFEIKKFCLLADEMRLLIRQTEFSFVEIPDLTPIIEILDPQNQRIPHFYIYSEYDETLKALREEFDALYDKNAEAAETVRLKAIEREDVVKQRLSTQLSAYLFELKSALEAVAQLDIAIAKAKLAIKLALCKPRIGQTKTFYKQLFNPFVKQLLSLQNKDFQAIDIEFEKEPTLITGVNMGGKTVFLRSLQIAQYLFQFGYYVPANQAEIVLVDDILTSLNDEGQNESSGLSSFAAEMAVISEIARSSKAKKNILVLIDELARTTNPHEGNAIVNAMLDLLSENNTRAFVTTHYGNIQSNCRKLRVKGLIENKMTENTKPSNINDCIDYSLVAHYEGDAPTAALAIARILKMDNDIIQKAEAYLQTNKSHH